MRPVTFDLEALRSFVVGVELGSFAGAAERLARSTSAVSAQLKKLERQTGTPLVRRAGRGTELTESGEALLGYARRLLELNDEAMGALRGVSLQGWVRLGLAEDFGEQLLPQVLGRFARAHPQVRIEACIGRHGDLTDGIRSGRLDLALAWDDGSRQPNATPLGEVPLHWVGAAERSLPDTVAPLPLAAFAPPCLMRSLATDALDRAGIAWRLAFTSPSLSGLWAAVAAGLGLTVRSAMGIPVTLRLLDPRQHGLPPLPSMGLRLLQAEAAPAPAVERLGEILCDDLRPSLRAAGGKVGHG